MTSEQRKFAFFLADAYNAQNLGDLLIKVRYAKKQSKGWQVNRDPAITSVKTRYRQASLHSARGDEANGAVA